MRKPVGSGTAFWLPFFFPISHIKGGDRGAGESAYRTFSRPGTGVTVGKAAGISRFLLADPISQVWDSILLYLPICLPHKPTNQGAGHRDNPTLWLNHALPSNQQDWKVWRSACMKQTKNVEALIETVKKSDVTVISGRALGSGKVAPHRGYMRLSRLVSVQGEDAVTSIPNATRSHRTGHHKTDLRHLGTLLTWLSCMEMKTRLT